MIVPSGIFVFVFVVQSVSGVVLYNETLVATAGRDAILNFTTQHGNPIFAAKFGLKGSGEDIKVKFIIVTKYHGIQIGDGFNSTKGSRFKNRISFVGNINKGHAWFAIKNLQLNDTRSYRVGIRENTDEKYKMYTVNLLVYRKDKTDAPVTKLSPTQRPSTEQTQGHTVTIDTCTEKIIPELVEVNQDHPIVTLISFNVISFSYAMYTLLQKIYPGRVNDFNQRLIEFTINAFRCWQN